MTHFAFFAAAPVTAICLFGCSGETLLPQWQQGMSPQMVIETEGLSKVFGRQRALDGVTLKVNRGAIGLLGPNGAGKTTLMKCLMQLQPITTGSAKLLGLEVGREGREIRKRGG